MRNCTVLAVDDNKDILLSLKLLLKSHVKRIVCAESPDQIPGLLSEVEPDILLLDMNFEKDASSGREGFDWLSRIQKQDPEAVVIFMTAYGDAEKAVQAIKAGATDFVLKPWQNEKLLATLSSACRLRIERKEKGREKARREVFSRSADQPFSQIIAESEPMKKVLATVKKVAGTDANILILGENGTGKEVIARAIHRESDRHTEPFVNVDLGAIPETLFESELFGHEKGAYTDASSARAGRFELAESGTLFLDEIANMNLTMQAKLLSVLERREVVRLGANHPRSIDIRLVSATNAGIHELVEQKAFRQDLLYRINTVEIHLPPLRDRKEDIQPLAKFYLEKFRKKYRKERKKLSNQALQLLLNYPWPGNIRELQHCLERALILSEGSVIEAENLHLQPVTKTEEHIPNKLAEAEKLIVIRVMEEQGGNISKAADELGITRTSLYRRLEKYGLS